MKIKMITLYAGPAGVMSPGGTYDVSEALGRSLVDGHFASAVKEPAVPAPVPAAPLAEEKAEEPPIEDARLTVEAMEQAVKPRRRKS